VIIQTALMNHLLLLLMFLPGFAFSQAPAAALDTATSRTRIYAALNVRNVLYKRDEYDFEKEDLQFTAVVLKRLDDGTITKGCRIYGNNDIWQNSSAMGYIDAEELDGIVSTLKYLADSVDFTKRPQQDVWVYYRTADDFEIGVRAAKGKKFEFYFRKNYRVLVERSFPFGRVNLAEAYKSFVSVRDFLKSH
jgi:hypothetical protein